VKFQAENCVTYWSSGSAMAGRSTLVVLAVL
jgi:hypothetical protein